MKNYILLLTFFIVSCNNNSSWVNLISENSLKGWHIFQNDGTIDFYLRIRTLINENSSVLDYGAGRSKWYEDEECDTRKNIRYLKNDVKILIAADIDNGVLENRSSHNQVLIEDSVFNYFEKESFDIIIADYVLEHVDDVEDFKKNIDYLLKKGGVFCARTPHKYAFVSIFAQLIKNHLHNFVLKYAQPKKKEIDTFDTKFKLNTLGSISNTFNTTKGSLEIRPWQHHLTNTTSKPWLRAKGMPDGDFICAPISIGSISQAWIREFCYREQGKPYRDMRITEADLIE